MLRWGAYRLAMWGVAHSTAEAELTAYCESLVVGKATEALLHPYAKVLAMFAFDSYSQSKRSPRPLSRHRPCKTPFPIGNASFNKP